MKNKSVFSQIMLLIIIALICVILTVVIALFAGSVDTTLFDFENLNFSNMWPVILLGGFISCVVIGIAVLFISRSIFFKAKNYFTKTNENENGGTEK